MQSLILRATSWLTIVFISLFLAQSGANGKHHQRVLVVAGINQYIQSHYKFAHRISVLLARQPYVEHVHLLVPALSKEDKELLESLKKKEPKLSVESYMVSETEMTKLANYPTEEELREWTPQLSRQEHLGPEWKLPEEAWKLRLFRLKQDFLLFQCMARDESLIQRLRGAHFTWGITEWFHLGALQLFPLAGINQHVMTRTLPMDTPFYEYMGLMEEVIEKKLPERRALLREGRAAMERESGAADDHAEEWERNWHFYEKADQAFADIYSDLYKGVESKTFGQLIRASKAHFLNLQLGADFPQVGQIPFPPDSVKFIGGLAVPPSMKAQKQATKEVLSDVEEYGGLVLISFGTALKTAEMSVEFFDKFLHAIRDMPDNLFVWSFEFAKDLKEKEKDPKRKVSIPANLRLLEWVEQPAILAHPATKAFFSHCGYNSLLESLQFGVPLLCMPVFSDQPYNAYAAEKQGIGHVLELEQFNQKAMKEGLGKVIALKTEPRFTRLVTKVQEEMKNAVSIFETTIHELFTASSPVAESTDVAVADAGKGRGRKRKRT